MSPHLRGAGHIGFGAGRVDVGIGVTLCWRLCDTFLSTEYLVNQWLDSYQIIVDT